MSANSTVREVFLALCDTHFQTSENDVSEVKMIWKLHHTALQSLYEYFDEKASNHRSFLGMTFVSPQAFVHVLVTQARVLHNAVNR